MFSSRRQRSSVPKSPPPPYSSTRSRPPSYQSSPLRSLDDFDQELEDRISIADSYDSYIPRQRPSKPIRGPEKKKRPKPLKPIPESVWSSEPETTRGTTRGTTQSSRRSRNFYFFLCCPITCIGNRGPLCSVSLLLLGFAIIVAMALGIALPLVMRHEAPAIPSNSTATVTSTLLAQTTSIVTSTTLVQSPTTATVTTSSPVAIAPSPTTQPPQNYLGGFDVVNLDGYEVHMFYTDQQGNIQHVYDDSSWQRANPAQIATNVKPGSPVSASLVSGQVHVFYVDNNNTIKGIFGTPSCQTDTCYPDTWYQDPINSLQVTTSDSLFIKTCVPSDMSTNYQYFSNASLYLYFSSPSDTIQKYALTGAGSFEWESIGDLPATPSAGEIECQLSAGTETLWMINTQQYVEQWYRSNQTSWEWERGFTGADSVYANTSLLSISDPSLNRTHIFFQTASQNVQRYDFYGFGSAIVMTDSESLGPATPGTRLATWATEGYCTETVDVYYQEGNTSDVHYTSFSDSCQYSYGYTPDCYVTSTTTGDQVLPLVRTYGQNVKHLWKPSRAVISGLVIGGIVVLGLLVCCCCACMA